MNLKKSLVVVYVQSRAEDCETSASVSNVAKSTSKKLN